MGGEVSEWRNDREVGSVGRVANDDEEVRVPGEHAVEQSAENGIFQDDQEDVRLADD